jgi:5-methylcytosine-specific restriction endonuclease McrA
MGLGLLILINGFNLFVSFITIVIQYNTHSIDTLFWISLIVLIGSFLGFSGMVLIGDGFYRMGSTLLVLAGILTIFTIIGIYNWRIAHRYWNVLEAKRRLWTYPPDPEWPEIRRKILERDGYRCSNCGKEEFLDVHHIVPLSRGGTTQPSNLITLRRDCHAKIHPHMEK